jgi:hypothetical protein
MQAGAQSRDHDEQILSILYCQMTDDVYPHSNGGVLPGPAKSIFITHARIYALFWRSVCALCFAVKS